MVAELSIDAMSGTGLLSVNLVKTPALVMPRVSCCHRLRIMSFQFLGIEFARGDSFMRRANSPACCVAVR